MAKVFPCQLAATVFVFIANPVQNSLERSMVDYQQCNKMSASLTNPAHVHVDCIVVIVLYHVAAIYK